MRQEVEAILIDNGIEGRFLTEFDDAIIGIDQSTFGVVYSVKKIIEILIDEDEDTGYEDALDHFGYNIERGVGYMGDNKPILCYDMFLI